ncbi:hypothetical protein LBK6_14330 [Leptospira borgpetersenii serovar Hardjo]|nr:hypothetical protein LBK6_14330 [Leptospira borgpetersenii serovar Hardjo]AMX62681.1 hypothetical protein LBK9_14250 [Leptospira borgpetersenii serovar Hardjo]AMX65924.1 hypothetical protein LBK30_14260 [Leptospira borgpetersenii serovar Hardjo]AMX69157.1 hypothetical protein LBHA_14215 [Leptospira borgpetersenii serovar Hardjo]
MELVSMCGNSAIITNLPKIMLTSFKIWRLIYSRSKRVVSAIDIEILRTVSDKNPLQETLSFTF